jgi:hypothetical protein
MIEPVTHFTSASNPGVPGKELVVTHEPTSKHEVHYR